MHHPVSFQHVANKGCGQETVHGKAGREETVSLSGRTSSGSSFVPPLGAGVSGLPIPKEGTSFPLNCLEALGFSSTFRMKTFSGSDRERFSAEVALLSGLLMGFFLLEIWHLHTEGGFHSLSFGILDQL